MTGIVCVHDKTIFSPARGRACIAFSIDVLDMQPIEPGGWRVPSRFQTVDACPFVLEAEGGERVLVDSAFVELVDVPVEHVAGEHFSREHWENYCLDRGLHAQEANEGVVVPGERVTVVGIVERRLVPPGRESGFRDSGSTVALVGDFDHPVLVQRA
ncbi:MAG: hypothetical protein ACKV2T_39935 [Kofleriaceae bacterium]